MNTPEDIQLQSSEVHFFQLAKRESSPRTRIRLLALGHLKAGKSKQEVTDMFQIVLITLRRWVLRFVAMRCLECIHFTSWSCASKVIHHLATNIFFTNHYVPA